ncbi:hypothetical protein B9G69_011025 [Bdellovibrio sp. SKB1291214]|uniref:hypothetical protein n=1 Tax=Bdellovibrio sp. SKB1291214 TaxID=1732569 RepID=UPI000B518CE4|nr:hypothetical protein [Bdellovibrio sp. SKB1291214]UYL07577.1 hypothetical protein B9G69_011025 [Bdellovibrio sp. SKB1291214]
MTRTQWIVQAFLCGTIAVIAACATKPANETTFIQPAASVVPKNTISINYSLRHNIYLFQLQSVNDSEFNAKSVVNEKVIEDRAIPREKYISFANRIYDFAEKYKSEKLAAVPDCKAPFNIRLEKAGQVEEVQGCRSNDASGELGKIIREGEILFYAGE